MRSVYIARCPTHGLHGETTECFVCGSPVEQVEMVEAAALGELLTPSPRLDEMAAIAAAGVRYVRARHNREAEAERIRHLPVGDRQATAILGEVRDAYAALEVAVANATLSCDSQTLNRGFMSSTDDPLTGANCDVCGATADNFHVSDELWERVGLSGQVCFKCFRIAAWHKGVRPDPAWEILAPSFRAAPPRRGDRVFIDGFPFRVVRCRLSWREPGIWTIKSLRLKPDEAT